MSPAASLAMLPGPALTLSLGSDVLGMGASAVFDAAGQWVAAGATWVLQQVVTVVSATTAAPIGTAWFAARLHVAEGIGAALALPLTCLAAVQAVVRQSPALLVRTVVVHLPVGLACAGTAAALVQLGLAVTDALSQQLLAATGTSAGGTLAPVSAAFGAAAGTVPGFAVLLGAVVVAVAGLGLWLEMAVRAAAVSLAVLFLPLVMAAMAWPALGHWCRRLAETLAALVLSKLVIVGALGLAADALANGLAGGPAGGTFGAVVTGAALLLVAAWCPFALLRIIPAVEAGAAGHLEQAGTHMRQAASSTLSRLAGRGAAGMDPGPIGPLGPVDGVDDLGAAGGASPTPGGGPGGEHPTGGAPAPAAAGAVTAAGATAGAATGPVGAAATAAGAASATSPFGEGGLVTTAVTPEQVALVREATDAGVPMHHLGAALARRQDGMPASEAYAPFVGGRPEGNANHGR